MAPELPVADGALGFWQAIEEIWPKTRGQHYWVHKTANILNKLPNKLPKSQHAKGERALQEKAARIVYPSGSALATAAAAIVPPAPARFSITIGCPSWPDS